VAPEKVVGRGGGRRATRRGLVATAGAILLTGFLAGFALTRSLHGDGDESDASGPGGAVSTAPGATGTGAATGADSTLQKNAVDPAPATQPTETGVGTAPTTEPTETVDPEKERLRAPCPVREFRLVFDRDTGAAGIFTADGRLLTSISPGSHTFGGELCRGVPAGAKRLSAEPSTAVYESGGVLCTVPGEIELEVHPIVDGATGGRGGTTLLVSELGRATFVLSAVVVEDLGGRRYYYSPAHCTPL
jgi:hypothetical protein